jgi:hypothetical protein
MNYASENHLHGVNVAVLDFGYAAAKADALATR